MCCFEQGGQCCVWCPLVELGHVNASTSLISSAVSLPGRLADQGDGGEYGVDEGPGEIEAVLQDTG